MKNKNFEKKSVKSFDKNYSANIFFKEPDKYREIENFSNLSEKIISSGSNYSYAPASFDEDSLSLDLKKFNRVLNFNIKDKEITVEAGVKIFEFLNFLLVYDLWIPQLPGYPYISLGGAVAANSHGKSCGIHGTIRNAVKSILIYHKTHGWLNLSKENNKEIFDLTIGGLGLTGTIVTITFRLYDFKQKSFITTKEKVSSVIECVEKIKDGSSNESFIYSWNRGDSLNNFGKGFVFKNTINKNSSNNFGKISERKKKVNFLLPFSLWNKLTIKLANSIYMNYQNWGKKEINEKLSSVIFPFVGKESYFQFFGSKGFIESQLLISKNKLDEFFQEFINLYRLHNPLITLFSVKNMSGEQKYLWFEDNKICITFDFVNNNKNLNFLTEIDKLCIKYEILPSIIKDSRINKATFDKCYKGAQEFRNKLRDFDKKRLYKSALSNRLEI